MLLSLLLGFYSTSQEAEVLAGLLSCSQVSLSSGTPKVYGEGGKVTLQCAHRLVLATSLAGSRRSRLTGCSANVGAWWLIVLTVQNCFFLRDTVFCAVATVCTRTSDDSALCLMDFQALEVRLALK